MRGTAIVGVGLAASQIISLLQMLVVSRLLGPEKFGAFGALAVLLLLGSTTSAAIQLVIARHVASGRRDRHVGTRPVLAVGGITAALTAILAPLAASALNLDDALGPLLVAVTFIPLAITGAQLGLLQGAERHARLGMLYVVSSAVRVGGAIIGAAVWGTPDATAAGLAIGALVGAVLGQLLLTGLPSWGIREESSRDFLAEVFHAAHALIALYALTNLDVLLARAHLSARDAGLYAAGGLVARGVFFLPHAVLIAAFPRMVAGARRAQEQAVLAAACLGLVATMFVALLPGLVVSVVAGPDYLEVTDDVWILALAGAGFGVVQVLLYARMAQHDRRATLLLWAGVLLLAVVGSIAGDSIRSLAICAAATAWTVALAGILWARATPRRPSR